MQSANVGNSGDSKSTKPRCFVISPIGAYGSEIRTHMDTVFHCIIEPALSEKYEVIRGDHTARPGRITEQFVEDILGHDLIVCVLTGNNANVYYELGIAESAARPIIVLRYRGDDVPFDVKDVRFIEYDFEPLRIFNKEYIKLVQRAEMDLSPRDAYEPKVPFAPHLTPLGKERFNFSAQPRYDLISAQVPEILAAAERSFYISGLSLRGWIANEGFIAQMKEKAKQGVECKVLLMAGDNPAVAHMLSKGMAGQEERIRRDSKESFDILSKYSEKNLSVRAARHGIIYQQLAMSEKSMIWAPYLYSRQTGQSPALRVDVSDRILRKTGLEHLYTAMEHEFEMLWYENSGPGDTEIALRQLAPQLVSTIPGG